MCYSSCQSHFLGCQLLFARSWGSVLIVKVIIGILTMLFAEALWDFFNVLASRYLQLGLNILTKLNFNNKDFIIIGCTSLLIILRFGVIRGGKLVWQMRLGLGCWLRDFIDLRWTIMQEGGRGHRQVMIIMIFYHFCVFLGLLLDIFVRNSSWLLLVNFLFFLGFNCTNWNWIIMIMDILKT